MKVCIATSDFGSGQNGITTFNKHLLHALLLSKHSVVVLTIADDKEIPKSEFTYAGNHFLAVSLKSTYLRYKKTFSKFFKSGGLDAPNWLATGYAMHEWLKQNSATQQIDIIEASDYGGFAALLIDNSLPPVFITGHGNLNQLSFFYNCYKKDSHYKLIVALEKLGLENSAGIITHSYINKKNLELLFRVNVAIAPIPFIKKIDKTNISFTGEISTLIVGSLYPVKGIYTLIEALRILADRKTPAKIHWVGSDTWMAPNHQPMAAFLENKYPEIWNKQFIWLDKMNGIDANKTIASSNIIVIPALFETFNYVALEAAQLGKAIIITDTTGAVEHFNQFNNALIIPANNPESLADAIIALNNDTDLQRKLGENALNMVNKLPDIEKIVSDRIAIYHKIIMTEYTNSDIQTQLSSLLNDYCNWRRRLYFSIRNIIKKIFVGNK